jgi:hypothetical protein
MSNNGGPLKTKRPEIDAGKCCFNCKYSVKTGTGYSVYCKLTDEDAWDYDDILQMPVWGVCDLWEYTDSPARIRAMTGVIKSAIERMENGG